MCPKPLMKSSKSWGAIPVVFSASSSSSGSSSDSLLSVSTSPSSSAAVCHPPVAAPAAALELPDSESLLKSSRVFTWSTYCLPLVAITTDSLMASSTRLLRPSGTVSLRARPRSPTISFLWSISSSSSSRTSTSASAGTCFPACTARSASSSH